jgi:GT2 family glycosyltransferase
VTYNSANVIQECLSSLGSDVALETIVVDNNSKDTSVTIASKLVDAGRIICLNENLGFAKAVNIGAANRDPTTEWIVLLNPDALFSVTDLLSLITAAETDSNVGVISPLIRHPSGRLRVMPFGREPTVWRMFCHFSGLSRMGGRLPIFEGFYALQDEATGLRDVDWVSGACMAVRADVWEALNGLTERWFMYAEDLEFCHRARAANWKVVWEGSTTATHWVGASSSGEELSMNPAWIENLYDYYKNELSTSSVGSFIWRAVVAGGLLSRALAFRLRALNPLYSDDENDWALEAKRFLRFAAAVVKIHA